MRNYSCVALNPNSYNHLTDHLAPLSVIMGMPLLLTSESDQALTQEYYPGVQTTLINWQEFTPQYLIENFDVFFQSEPWNRHAFYRSFEGLEKHYGKSVRNVFCPHGFSDKLFWFEKCVWEDITLYYGQNMIDMLKEMGVEQNLNAAVRTGNYRSQYYKEHQSFYDKLIDKQIFSRFAKKQPAILYAPTCNDQDKNTSFLDSEMIIGSLPASYNLIVKIHPRLEETDGPALYRMMGKYEHKKNIVFVKDLPLVYPILAKTDIYLGDRSSIGYDFLAFNRPMFFLNNSKIDGENSRNLFLFRCGVEVLPEQYPQLFQLMEKHLPFDREHYGKIREKIYHYTFGDEIPFEELKRMITQSFASPKKYD